MEDASAMFQYSKVNILFLIIFFLNELEIPSEEDLVLTWLFSYAFISGAQVID